MESRTLLDVGVTLHVAFPTVSTAPRDRAGWESTSIIGGTIQTRRENSPALSVQKKFYCLSKANLHLRRIHLKEKGYKFEECSYAAASLNELKHHHQGMHDKSFGVSRFSCKLCGYRAFSKRGQAPQMWRVHLESWEFNHPAKSSKLLPNQTVNFRTRRSWTLLYSKFP